MGFFAERYSGLAAFRAALRTFFACSEAICRKGDVTTTQYQAMLAIGCSSETLSIKRLAALLLLEHHSAVQLVDRLSTAGLLECTVSARDGRLALVVLTAKGESKLEKLAEQHLAEMQKQEPRLSSSLRLLKKQRIFQ